jgi:hypothetical protein
MTNANGPQTPQNGARVRVALPSSESVVMPARLEGAGFDGVDIIRERREAIDRNEQACGLLPLAEQDQTWERRHRDIIMCLAHLLDGPPDVAALATAGAYLSAFIEAVLAAETVRVDTGEAA